MPSSTGVPVGFGDGCFAATRERSWLPAEPERLRQRFQRDGYLRLSARSRSAR